jgi:hypothetical protein
MLVRRLALSMLTALSIAFGLIVPTAIAAGPPVPATGSFTQLTFEQSNVRTADGVTFFDFTATSSVSGTLSGASVASAQCVVRASGEGTCTSRETFAGTVLGRTGTAEFAEVLRGNFSTGSLTGSFTIVGGTGGLTNLRGQGTFVASSGAGTYSGWVAFGP